MNNQNSSEVHIKSLTDMCQNVCTFIKSISKDNVSKDDEIKSLVSKIDDLQVLCVDLNNQLEGINKHVKTLASLLNFTTNQDDSTVNVLEKWIHSLSNKNIENVKKRKLFSSYSPLKLSLKDTTEMSYVKENKSNYSKLEKENTNSSHNKFKKVWKLQVKVDGKPSDLLKKSKQTTLNLQFQKDKVDMDITTFNYPKSKTSNLNSSIGCTPEAFNETKNNVNGNSSTQDNERDDFSNISLSHFNKIIKPHKNILPNVKTNILKLDTSHIQTENHDQSSNETVYNPINILKLDTSHIQAENHDQSSNETVYNPINNLKLDTSHIQTENHNQSSNETMYSPINISTNVIKNTTISKKQSKSPDKIVLNNIDIIPGINVNKNNLPNYNFKEDPVRKRCERKLLNGWDCAECCKFYEANNDNPVEAKNAMNHFSRHRSVKHQHHAPTPPGFWDPI